MSETNDAKPAETPLVYDLASEKHGDLTNVVQAMQLEGVGAVLLHTAVVKNPATGLHISTSACLLPDHDVAVKRGGKVTFKKNK